MTGIDAKPVTQQADLAKLPKALAPLMARAQWVVWRWTIVKGRWSKPPFQALDPRKHASTADPNTWTDYTTALACVQAGHADGITFVLTAGDGLGVLDLDNCRDPQTAAIDMWAQLLLMRSGATYVEISPSGKGLHVWGTATGESLNRKLLIDPGEYGKIGLADPAIELFRNTGKALTVSGLTLHRGTALENIDGLFKYAEVFAGRHKLQPKPTAAAVPGQPSDGGGSRFSIDEIDDAVRTGAHLVGSRSETFHVIVGHYHGCGWTPEQIFEHMAQFPEGICAKYLAEGRLSGEIDRSIRNLRKYSGKPELDVKPWTGSWEAPAAASPPPAERHETDEELDEVDTDDLPPWEEQPSRAAYDDIALAVLQEQEEQLDELDQQDLGELDQEDLVDDQDPDLDEDELLDEPGEPWQKAQLPEMHYYGEPDQRPLTSWLVKGIIPACGHGLLSGQWGACKTFAALDLSGSVMSGQPFLDRLVMRQSGVLYLAAEGESEIRLRVEVLMAAKYGSPAEVPFLWYEAVPALLQKGASDLLVAMAEQADRHLQEKFGLPLGLLILDTVTAAAGYSTPGAENDAAICQQLMNVLKAAAPRLSCFCLGIDHFGKNQDSGTRGSSSKESSADVVLACLGERDTSGQISDLRLAVRKCRSGVSGLVVPFTTRIVNHPTALDEEGKPETSLVIDWHPGALQPTTPTGSAADPWQQAKRKDKRQALLRLRRVLMAMLATRGTDRAVPPDGPTVRMVDREIVKPEFFATSTAEGTEKQKADARRLQFKRALEWAEEDALIGIREIDGVTYLWLSRPEQAQSDEKSGDEGT
jgi:hypothetical protein